MSYELVDAVFPLILPPVEKAVLLALCRHAKKDGSSTFPSVHLLTAEAAYSERSVQRALRSLEAREYIVAIGNKAGGRHGQTVSYRVLIPNADIIAAVQSLWKEGLTGASVAPDSEETGLTGASVAPTGASVAPKAVREPVREPVRTPTTTDTGGQVAGVRTSEKSAGTPKADSVIAWFVESENKAMPASRKAKLELEQMLDAIPDAIGKAAITNWLMKRDLKGLDFPMQALLSELPAYIKIETKNAK